MVGAPSRSLAARYTRCCMVFGTVLIGSLPPCVAVALLAPSLPRLGLLRPVILSAPAAVAGGLTLVATYYLSQAASTRGLRPAPARVAGGALALFVLGTLTLALPAALYAALPGRISPAVVSPEDARLDVLRQRALRHADARVRAASARTLYLTTGKTVPYRDAVRRVVEFSPTSGDRRRLAVQRWLTASPGASPEERRVLAGTAILLITGVLLGLPLAAACGRRRRPDPWL